MCDPPFEVDFGSQLMSLSSSNNDVPQGQLATTRANATASVSELQEFLRGLRGKDPHEILGAITQSGLVRATVQATIGTLIVIVLFTVGPYLVAKQFPPTAKAAPAPTPASTTPTPAAAAASPAAGPNTDPATPSSSSSPAANATTVLNKLGENETKKASPKVNPLDKKDDDLLKDLFNK